MRPWRPAWASILLLAACHSPPRTPPASGALESLAWLEGCWVSNDRGSRVEECWMRPDGDVMMGMGRTTRDGRVVEWEHLRIEAKDGDVFFVALPSGQTEASFKRAETSFESVTFANDTHDYPKRVSYRRAGNGLIARIEGRPGERVMEWSYSRAE